MVLIVIILIGSVIGAINIICTYCSKKTNNIPHIALIVLEIITNVNHRIT